MWRFRSPRNIYFGKGSLKYLSGLEGKKAFVVTDKNVRSLGFSDIVVKHLKGAGIEAKVFDEIEGEPTKEMVEKGTKILSEYGADWIIALGGGSAMDAAKVMWIFYERPDLGWKELLRPGLKLGLRKKAKFITIPTTSGTGADVTWGIVIVDAEQRRKIAFASSEVIADAVILEPALAQKMPPQVTADTGLDALTHAIEAYVATWKNDFSDGLSVWAARLVFKFLPRAYANPDDMEAREKMHNAATISGLGFGNSQAGLVHSLGHSLGAMFKIPHGRCMGLFLPYVIEYNSRMEKTAALYADMAKNIGVGENAGDLVKAVRSLESCMKSPTAIKDILNEKTFLENLDALVERARGDPCTATNPISPSNDELRNLFMRAYEGEDVNF